MASWLEKYDQERSLEIFSRELFAYRAASSGLSSVVKSVVRALKSGLAVGAVIAALAAAGYAGPEWKQFVDRVSSGIVSGDVDESNIDSIAKEELEWKGLDPSGGKPTPRKSPPPSVRTEPAPVESAEAPPENSMFSYISKHEGTNRKKPGYRYFDSYKKPTIGVGHLLGNERSRNAFKGLFGNSVNYEDILAGRAGLNEKQEKMLFDYDVRDKTSKARRNIREYDNLDQQTKNALVSAFYRGDIGPKTIALMNAGRWEEASREYLDHNEYLTAKRALEAGRKINNAGIVPRMEQNAAAFRAQANR